MKYLCIGPGGMGLYAFLGVLKNFEDELKEVEEYSGASAGSLLCLFLACGKTIDEILGFCLKLDLSKYTKLSLTSFIKSYGFINTRPIKETLVEFIGGDPTFKSIDKKLYISTYCINKHQTEYMSVDTYPDMSIIDAVCMSISIPFVFSSIEFNDMLYIDGGTVEDLPIPPFYLNDPNEILCIKLKHSDIGHDINDIKDYSFTLLKSFMRLRINHDPKKLINVDVGQNNIFNFKMSEYDKIKLYTIGLQTNKDF